MALSHILYSLLGTVFFGSLQTTLILIDSRVGPGSFRSIGHMLVDKQLVKGQKRLVHITIIMTTNWIVELRNVSPGSQYQRLTY